jgi:hypothetical protein
MLLYFYAELVICVYFNLLNLSAIHSLQISFRRNKVEPGYNDIGLNGTSSVASDTPLYQLIPYCLPLNCATGLEQRSFYNTKYSTPFYDVITMLDCSL